MIKPIETTYNGYRFRSRLEARWAVFFDAAGIKWVYERQGYEVNGRPYLPDFWLPAFGHFEARGIEFDCDDELLQALADGTKAPVFIAFNEIPAPDACDGYLRGFYPEGDPRSDYAWGYDDMFLQCTRCGDIRIANEAYCTMKDACNCSEMSRLMPLSDALAKARSARFEHGETAHA